MEFVKFSKSRTIDDTNTNHNRKKFKPKDVYKEIDESCPKTPLFYPAALPIAFAYKNAQSRYLGLIPGQESYHEKIDNNISMI